MRETDGTIVGTFLAYTVLTFLFGLSMLRAAYSQYLEISYYETWQSILAGVIGGYLSFRHIQWYWKMAQAKIIAGWMLILFAILSCGLTFNFLMWSSMTGVQIVRISSILPYLFSFEFVSGVLGFIIILLYLGKQLLSTIFP